MNTSSHSSTDRIARPGDIFLLLVPTTHELKELRERQLILQSQYGGEIVDFVHITCERFSPNEKKEERICIDYLKHNVTALAPFTLYAAKIVQYYAPYWGEEVLRWQVQETDDYKHLRNVLAADHILTGTNLQPAQPLGLMKKSNLNLQATRTHFLLLFSKQTIFGFQNLSEKINLPSYQR